MSIITIKPHSTTKHLFTQEQDSYEVEVSTYGELISYLENVHPRVAEHIKNPSDECTPITIMNSKFERLEERGMLSTRFVENGILHVCALFGGEKRIITRVVRSIAKVVRSIGRAIKRGIDHIKRWFTDDIPTRGDPEEINNEGDTFWYNFYGTARGKPNSTNIRTNESWRTVYIW